jgi:hypothetical protein
MLPSHHQNADHNRYIRLADRQCENVSQLKCLGTTVINKNLIQKEIKRRRKSGNYCYPSLQKLPSSRFLSKNIKTKLYMTAILPGYLYGCETWSDVMDGT